MSKTRSTILKATLELISLRGFHDAPISKIAKHADISPASIYNHFKNKEDLIEKLYIETKRDLVSQFMKDIDFSADPRTIFRKAWMNVAYYYMNKKVESDFLEYFENTPMVKNVKVKEFGQIMLPFFDYVAKIKENEIIRNFDFKILGSLVFEVVTSLAKKHTKGEIILNESLLEQTFEACWTGIKAPY